MRRWTPASASSSILACSETVARPIRISPGTSSSNATSREAACLVSPPSACLHGKPADGHASRGWRVALANGRQPVGWVASDDIAAVAAKVLAEGPERHAGKNYYLSTDVLNGNEVAGVLSRATDRP